MVLVFLSLMGIFFRFEEKTGIRMTKAVEDYSVEFLTLFVLLMLADFLNWLF